MEFVGVPAGPFHGRDSIAAAYRADPPDDTLSVEAVTSDADRDTVRFFWSQGTAGTMELTWRDGLVGRLSVAFDDAS